MSNKMFAFAYFFDENARKVSVSVSEVSVSVSEELAKFGKSLGKVWGDDEA